MLQVVENYKKETSGNFRVEKKSEIKSLLARFNGRIEMNEKKVSDLENGAIEFIKFEDWKEKKEKKKRASGACGK